MGFSTSINPFTNREVLCCDFCGGFRGFKEIKWVRKIPCPHGYCQAWATCNECFKKGRHMEHSSADLREEGKNHKSCKGVS